MPMSLADAHVRIARPSTDLQAAQRFWCDGVGMSVLFTKQASADEPHSLLMAGFAGASWHLELVSQPGDPVIAEPTHEDLLVIYLDGEVPTELVDRIVACGGTRVPADNPYWDRWGVTVEDPDGYRLVLSTRGWSNG